MNWAKCDVFFSPYAYATSDKGQQANRQSRLHAIRAAAHHALATADHSQASAEIKHTVQQLNNTAQLYATCNERSVHQTHAALIDTLPPEADLLASVTASSFQIDMRHCKEANHTTALNSQYIFRGALLTLLKGPLFANAVARGCN